MKRKKIIVSLFLASVMSLSAFAGCGPKAETPAPAKQEAPAKVEEPKKEDAKAEEPKKEDEKPAEQAAAGELEPYSFVHYFNYDYWGLKPWGQDEASKFLQKKFNVNVEFQKPDADAAAKLNLMISSGDLPDSIMMDRGPDNIKMAKLGLLMPLEPYQAVNKDYDNNLLPATQELLKVEGKLYGIPNWARKGGTTGGNDGWLYNKRIYEAAGKPPLKTFEDMYAYAKKVKETVPTTKEGQPVIPFVTDLTTDGDTIVRSFYRSFGGVNKYALWYGRYQDKMQLILRDPLFKKATLEGNKWYREGLIGDTQFSDTGDQILEKLVAGRAGLIYYDFSKDDANHFRSILRETFPDDSYEVLTDPVYPPAGGIAPEKVYADEKPTVGWNVTCITNKAQNPQRIFDLFSYMLTKEGSINMMYGPQGGLWDELDGNGNPKLKTPEELVPTAEKDRLGLWFWPIPGHADNVDETKFAVNDMQPEDKRSWVISNQAHVFTPVMFSTDEYVGITDVIEQGTDLAINKTLCEDQIKATIPKIIMASSEDEANKLYDELIAFCDKNGMAGVEAAYDVRYQENVKIQGGTKYNR